MLMILKVSELLSIQYLSFVQIKITSLFNKVSSLNKTNGNDCKLLIIIRGSILQTLALKRGCSSAFRFYILDFNMWMLMSCTTLYAVLWQTQCLMPLSYTYIRSCSTSYKDTIFSSSVHLVHPHPLTLILILKLAGFIQTFVDIR